MFSAGRRSLLLVLVFGLLGVPATAVAAAPRSASTSDHAGRALQATGGHGSRATGASYAASFRDDRGTVLTFISAEKPYVDTLTLRQAELHDAMLAYEMDGKPLAREHGAPVRVVIPEMYGYKNVKWVEQITVTGRVEPGYWEQRGYDVDAWVGRSNNRDDNAP